MRQLNIPTIKYRRLRGDMIVVFKIAHNYYDFDVAVELPLNTRATTRGNKFKLESYSFHYDLRK